MKYVMSLLGIALLASACTVRSETVVEKPVAAPPGTIVYDPAPPPPPPTRSTTTVIVPSTR